MSLLYVSPASGGKLFQAGVSEIPQLLQNNNIYALILSAREFQPKLTDFQPDFLRLLKGTHIFYVPLLDMPFISQKDLSKVDEISSLAAMFIIKGKNVLSTCYAGLNRSGLISGHILKKITGASGNTIIDHIQKHRNPRALSNSTFAKIITKL